VGKSVIFNALTGMNQTIGNWPGKTVELAQGNFLFRGQHLRVVDLPGIYSLSTYSQEELVARDFLAAGVGDVVLDVLDSTVLERNLYLTLQLRELQVPMMLVLNLSDAAAKEGLDIDEALLGRELGVAVVKTAATSGKGLEDVVQAALVAAAQPPAPGPWYGREVEDAIRRVGELLAGVALPAELDGMPVRFIAIKLLEDDPEVVRILAHEAAVTAGARRIAEELETLHGHEASGIMAAERYAVAGRIAAATVKHRHTKRAGRAERLDSVLLHKSLGWLVLAVTMFAVFGLIFLLGGRLAGLLDEAFSSLQKGFYGLPLSAGWADFLWHGLIQGILAGVSVALPYLVPFYVVLSLLENSGYLARMAFLTDTVMHRLGLHGKAFIPIFLGYGCSVPAILGTRIMERNRDRLIAGILATLIPCSARTVVILGLVGVFIGFWPAVSLYLLDLLIVLVAGRVLNRYLPGESVGLIMEMPKLRTPPVRVSLKQTWFRLKDFVAFAFPIIAAGSLVLYGLDRFGWLEPLARALAPFTQTVLGLPPVALMVLAFGVLRKELALIMLAALLGTANFGLVLNARQMYVFALIVVLYIPCVSAIAVFRREFGTRTAVLTSAGEVLLALALGALVNWIWNLSTALTR
jgi:ferrous iron transport protein B